MSNEDFYDNDLENIDDQVCDDVANDDFEVVLSRRAPKGDVFIQVFARTRHWIRAAVRPEEIIREDKDDMVFSFVKRMKDPAFNPEDGVRYIKFRCTVALSELEIEMSFTHVELFYQDVNGDLGIGTPLSENAKECSEVKSAFEKVIINLANYLSKP